MIDPVQIHQLLDAIALPKLQESPSNVQLLRKGNRVRFMYHVGPVISEVLSIGSQIGELAFYEFGLEWDGRRLSFHHGNNPSVTVELIRLRHFSEWLRILGIERLYQGVDFGFAPIPHRADHLLVDAMRQAETMIRQSTGMGGETHTTARRVVNGTRYTVPCRIATHGHGMVYHCRYGQRLGHAMACVKGDDATITWDSEARQCSEARIGR